jgi:hypothetical protein
MNLKKKAKVVILATENKTNLFICNNILSSTNNHQNILAGVKEYPVIYQNLYILSDNEIKESDWYYCSDESFGGIGQHTNQSFRCSACKKIIATTDKSIACIEDVVSIKQRRGLTNHYPTEKWILPQPSLQFVQKYIEEYNKGNIITDVMVDYIQYNDEELYKITELKVDSNNCITITKLNEKGEHILRFVKDFINEFPEENLEYLQLRAESWIEKNL